MIHLFTVILFALSLGLASQAGSAHGAGMASHALAGGPQVHGGAGHDMGGPPPCDPARGCAEAGLCAWICSPAIQPTSGRLAEKRAAPPVARPRPAARILTGRIPPLAERPPTPRLL